MFGRPGRLMAPVGGLDTLLAGGTAEVPVAGVDAACGTAVALCGMPGISFSRM